MKRIRLSKADVQSAEIAEFSKELIELPPGQEFQNKFTLALVLVFEERHYSKYGRVL